MFNTQAKTANFLRINMHDRQNIVNTQVKISYESGTCWNEDDKTAKERCG